MSFSINKITLLESLLNSDDILSDNILILANPEVHWFNSNDLNEIISFLESLEIGKAYVITLELIFDLEDYNSNHPTIVLSKPFVITNESNPVLIKDLIVLSESLALASFQLKDKLDELKNDSRRPLILAKYKCFN
uniref:Uncharacterized protein n=1 Tax=Russula virescens TaxID=71688 RepID=A0A2S0U459_9AGAM|nr:hypothetical protein [Russula virescens]AWB36220.1 hypothetical protein [Russula virescens]